MTRTTTRTTPRAIAAIALGIAAALTLSACGDRTDRGTGREAATAASTEYGDADVAFAQQMIPHHAQAVHMAEMAKSHAGSPEVRRLAAEIEAAQGPEIATMTGWLEQWGEEVPGSAGGHMDHGMPGMEDMDGMPGMMSDRQLGSLDRASGGAWDRMFLRMMIAHHEGAIEMAETEISEGQNADAVELAERIVEAQEAEIVQMRAMLRP